MNAKNSDKCKHCGSHAPEQHRHCPTCGTDLGTPNLRQLRRRGELDILIRRFAKARKSAVDNAAAEQFDQFRNVIDSESSVVIAIPAHVALNLVTDESALYSNYESLVGAGARTPALLEHDSLRRAIAGQLFPSFGEEIRYGVLSVNGFGLPTYGDVYFRLKPSTIKNRCTFLEWNSYDFVRSTARESLPVGHMSDWDHRAQLATIKSAQKIDSRNRHTDINEIILYSDGKSRENDEFIEAHIYGPITVNSFETIRTNQRSTDKKVQRTVNLVVEYFSEHQSAS